MILNPEDNKDMSNKNVSVEQDIPKTITIPGPAIEVDMSRVIGDWESGIRFEMNTEETQREIDEHKDDESFADYVSMERRFLKFMKKGGRIFATESDSYMFVAPEGKEIQFPMES